VTVPGLHKKAQPHDLRNMKVTAATLPTTQDLESRLRALGRAGFQHDCKPVTDILAKIGEKWSVLIIKLLGSGPKRYNEMRRLVHGISQRMLTLTLRGLERHGLVNQTAFPTISPRVAYQLTERDRSLLVPSSGLGEWAYANRAIVEAAREQVDAK
jgi:DNA-binding HxlR family transcriptional regulator